MMVRPALISARSAPDTSPLKSWETKMPQFSKCLHPASRLFRVLRLSAASGSSPPQSRGWEVPLSTENSGRIAQLAAERRVGLHDAVACDDLDHLVVVVLALH